MRVEAAAAPDTVVFARSIRIEQVGGGILAKAVHEEVMTSVVLPGRFQSIWHVVTSSKFVVPVLLLNGKIVRVSVRRGISNSAVLRKVKLVWIGAVSRSC